KHHHRHQDHEDVCLHHDQEQTCQYKSHRVTYHSVLLEKHLIEAMDPPTSSAHRQGVLHDPRAPKNHGGHVQECDGELVLQLRKVAHEGLVAPPDAYIAKAGEQQCGEHVAAEAEQHQRRDDPDHHEGPVVIIHVFIGSRPGTEQVEVLGIIRPEEDPQEIQGLRRGQLAHGDGGVEIRDCIASFVIIEVDQTEDHRANDLRIKSVQKMLVF